MSNSVAVSENKQPSSDELKALADILGSINPNLAALAGSIAAFAGGAFLLLDDAHDFGKFGNERDPPIPHHWTYGVFLMFGGVAGVGLTMLNLLASNPKGAQQIRERMEEARLARKALSPEVLEKLLKE